MTNEPGALERLWPEVALRAAKVTQTLFYGTIPSAQLLLPHIRQASFADREKFACQILAELVPEILLLAGAKLDEVTTRIGPGGYKLKTTLSLQSHVHLSDSGADRVAAALGWVFRQYSVLAADLNDTVEGHTYYVIADFPTGSVTPVLADTFFQHAASIDPGLGEGYTAFGDDLLFLNVRSDEGMPYSRLEDDAFDAAIQKAVATFSTVRVSAATHGVADARFIKNDWKRDLDGEAYEMRLDPGLIAALAPLRQRHTRLVLEAADRYRWR